MAFTYQVDVKLPSTPDFAERLVTHFSRLRFSLIEDGGERWTFRRGHYLATFYRFDIRAYATTLRVSVTPLSPEKVHVRFTYEIWIFLAIPVSEDIAKLEAEVAEFVAAPLLAVGDPREHMSASRQPGQFLPLWLIIVLIFIVPGLVFALLMVLGILALVAFS